MSRPILAALIAAAALALLASVAWQSRSVPIDAHVARNTIGAGLERAADEFGTLVSTLDSSWRETRAPGDGARAIATSLAETPTELRAAIEHIPGNASQRRRVANSFETYESVTNGAVSLAGELLDETTAYADSVAYLREAGPQTVQTLTGRGLERMAADTFELMAGVLEFARPGSARSDTELRRLHAVLGRDGRADANVPDSLGRLLGAVETILATKSNIVSKLEQLAGSPLAADAASLREAVDAAYTASVRTADQARLMLSVYAALLLAGFGYVAFRLQRSYRELNSAYTDLAALNESLEQRVRERTNELEATLNNLKESQVRLVQAEKMSSLGQLVAAISHEINTPLLYLANNAVLIQERLELAAAFLKRSSEALTVKPDDFATRAEYQAHFIEALRRLKVMIREEEIEANLGEALDLSRDSIEGLGELTEMAQSLKDFSRLDRAPVSSFDVNSGLDKTLLIARNLVKNKADVRKFYGDVPEIECSPSQINQVFLNLITNAAQAIETHGEIVITTRQYDEHRIAVTISDTGCGISERHLEKIREPFFTTKEVGAGTGLGLSIVDQIVASHGGELHVESRVGEGSSFTVLLPIRQGGTSGERAEGTREAEETGREAEPVELEEAV